MKKLLTAILCLATIPAFAIKKIELNDKNTINFNEAFTSKYVAEKQIEAIVMCASNVGSTINLVLYTPGGSVSAGQRLFDTLHALPCTFNTITIFSASMGFQTVQQLNKRYILPSGTLMSHRASVSGLGGEVGGELDSILNSIKASVRELDEVAAQRAGITLKQYEEQIRDELWMTGAEAVRLKYADEIVLVTCDKSLLGTRIQRFNTMFGSFDIEFSNCPIVTGPLRIQPTRSGQSTEKITDYFSNIKKHITTEL